MITTHYNTINHIADGKVDRLEGLNILQLESSRREYIGDIKYNLTKPVTISENLVTKPTDGDKLFKDLDGLLMSIFERSFDRRIYNVNIKIIKPKKTYFVKGIKLYRKYYPTIKY